MEIMNQQTVNAIYQNGVLRPLADLDLPENSEVELDVKVIEPERNSRRAIDDLLVREGLSLPRRPSPPKQHLSPEERKRLSILFSSPQPLGDLISEDREERI